MEKKNPITAISDRVCWVEKQITWIAFIVMLGLLVIQVACRYCFHFPLAWSEELVRFIYVAVSYTGAIVAVRENEHICINIIPIILKKILKDRCREERVLKVLDLAADGICAVFWIFISYGVLGYIAEVKEKAMLSTANEWPMWIVFVPVLMSGILIIFHYIMNGIETAMSFKKDGEAKGGEVL
ncbi:MAG: TRAP transporter small permease subunit [Clostridiales Family XIII bacterium]|nr:TRAP transporter small permease subunit [Clostridia bacterium]MDY3009767.1 TRAP transporter small permease subunit [Clostridiales Family XIII bacterium]